MIERNTMQKKIIRLAVYELGNHPTAEQVYRMVHKKYPNISKATIYRNLALMAKSGELLNAGTLSDSTHYDHMCHDHYHFICDDCGKVFDINVYFDDIRKMLPANIGDVEIRGHSLSFNGLCKDCLAKEAKKNEK